MTNLRRQVELLRRARGFRMLFLATAASTLGTLLAAVALVVDVKDRTNSGPWVSVLLIVQFLPSVAVGLFFGPLLDRLSRRATMIAADVVRLGVFCALPFVQTPGAIVGLAAVTGLATGFFRPAAYAGLPNLVDEGDLAPANSLLQTAENVSWTVGPVVGGVLVAAAGPHVAYWVNAASFGVSAVLIAGIPQRLLQAAAATSRGHLRDLRDGLAFVLRTRALRAVLVAWTIAMGAVAAVNTTEVFLAKNTFDAGDVGYGVLFGSIGLGLALGSFAAGALVDRRPLGIVYGGGILLTAIGVGSAAAAPDVWVAAACCVLAGLGQGAAVVCNALLVQRGAPDELRGRAFTVIMGVNYIVFGLGFVAGGLLNDRFGARWVWGGSAVVLGLSGLVAYALARGVSIAPAVAEPEPAVGS